MTDNQIIAKMCMRGLFADGVITDIENTVQDRIKHVGVEATKRWANEVATAIDFCNSNLKDFYVPATIASEEVERQAEFAIEIMNKNVVSFVKRKLLKEAE